MLLQLLKDYSKFCDSVQGKWPTSDPSRQNPNVRTLMIPIFNLFHAEVGNRQWKRELDVVVRDAKSLTEVLDRTLHCFSDEVLDKPPEVPEGMTAAEWLAKLEELPVPPLEEDFMSEGDDARQGKAPRLDDTALHNGSEVPEQEKQTAATG